MGLRHQSIPMCHHDGGRRHLPVVCNERREPHTSHYPSRQVTKNNNQQFTHTSHYRSRPVEVFLELYNNGVVSDKSNDW